MTPASTNLADCAAGTRAIVRTIDVAPVARQRLLEMGLTVGCRIDVVKFAPLGDPVEIRLRGYHLSLRKSEAAAITVDCE